ncbi:class I heat shock protein [Sesamum angolense]|uniref:Class I heat shock protein n=1 Tax=Sesamum angolense TaxID=2727404 RepID=A0AAE1X877_9LAMI|nr:class I heat shock protein [Sesamum angolense]
MSQSLSLHWAASSPPSPLGGRENRLLTIINTRAASIPPDSAESENVSDSKLLWQPAEQRLRSDFATSVANLPSSARETTAIASARIDWKETPEAHVFKVDVPGLKKEEVKVEVEDGTILQISGERSKEQEEKKYKWHRVERSSGKFLRRFRLPENAKLDQVKAAMENGVLTVTVPKEEVKKAEVKAIDISG